jgi:hypothetical protein
MVIKTLGTMYIAVNKKNPQEAHSFTWTPQDDLFINGTIVDKCDWDIIEVEPVKKLWNYRLTTSTIWLSFDHGQVEATSYDEAVRLATEKLKQDLQKANTVLQSCDPTIGFFIDMDFSQLEIIEEK